MSHEIKYLDNRQIYNTFSSSVNLIRKVKKVRNSNRNFYTYRVKSVIFISEKRCIIEGRNMN